MTYEASSTLFFIFMIMMMIFIVLVSPLGKALGTQFKRKSLNTRYSQLDPLVRQVLAEQVTLTAQDEEFVDIDDVPSDFRFFEWNDTVNGRVQDVPIHEAVRQLIERDGEDYRSEDAESPIPELRSRKKDDTKLARVQGYGKKAHEVEKQTKEEREAVLA